MTFPLPPDVHPKALAWLRRSAAHLETLSNPKRAAWLREWMPAAKRFPLDDGLTAFDLSIVCDTLLDWHHRVTSAMKLEAA